MNTYWAYWKRGLWAFLMLLCLNVVSIGIASAIVAIAFPNPQLMWTVYLTVGVFLVTPFAGWLFEQFAASSKRLGAGAGKDPSTRRESAAMGYDFAARA